MRKRSTFLLKLKMVSKFRITFIFPILKYDKGTESFRNIYTLLIYFKRGLFRFQNQIGARRSRKKAHFDSSWQTKRSRLSQTKDLHFYAKFHFSLRFFVARSPSSLSFPPSIAISFCSGSIVYICVCVLCLLFGKFFILAR